MEKKTLGSFLAALRKANGLTQRELAEKLNVSDKTISRWERDEGTPDLALIPVIAELFGVTSDELLRGERKAAGEEPSGAKGVKQRRRLLAASLSRYRNRSCLAAGLALCGLLAALVANFAFLRAYLGFFAGVVFFLAAALVQFTAVNAAFLAVDGEDLEEEQLADYRRRVIGTAERISGVIAVLLAVTAPLLLAGDAHWGLSGETFVTSGLLCGGIGLVLWAVVLLFVHRGLVKSGRYPMDPERAAVYHYNARLQKICALSLAAVLILTALLEGILVGFGDITRVARAEVFRDIDAFVAFMEQDVPDRNSAWMTPAPAPDEDVPIPDDSVQYYDANGNPITAEEAMTDTIVDPDGNVVRSFVRRNQSVWSWQCTWSGDTLLSLSVYTDDAIDRARAEVETIGAVFTAAYIGEAALFLLIYGVKHKKYRAR